MIWADISPMVGIGCNCVRQKFVSRCSYLVNRKEILEHTILVGLEANPNASGGWKMSAANDSKGSGFGGEAKSGAQRKTVHWTVFWPELGRRSSSYPYPGEFKRSQNWVMGTSPADARFVPPPPEYMVSAMGDLEEFFYSNQDIPALIKVALIHSQFETIHPFIDGNGRVGRLLVTLYLCQEEVLERPVLYLSEYFRKQREVYFAMLDEYRKGHVTEWLEFFLKGVIGIAKEAIETLDRIIDLREKDLHTVSTLGRASKNAIVLLKNLYKLPMVN